MSKGSSPRQSKISYEQWSENFDAIFDKKKAKKKVAKKKAGKVRKKK